MNKDWPSHEVVGFQKQSYWTSMVDLPKPLEWPNRAGKGVPAWSRIKQSSVLCRYGRGLSVAPCHVDVTQHIWNSIMVLQGEKHFYLFNGTRNAETDQKVCDKINQILKFDVYDDATSKFLIPFTTNTNIDRYICLHLSRYGFRKNRDYKKIILKPGDVLWIKETAPHFAVNIPEQNNQRSQQLCLITSIYLTNRLAEHIQEVCELEDPDEYNLARAALLSHREDVLNHFHKIKDNKSVQRFEEIIQKESLYDCRC